jgi:hypothetical protein
VGASTLFVKGSSFAGEAYDPANVILTGPFTVDTTT